VFVCVCERESGERECVRERVVADLEQRRGVVEFILSLEVLLEVGQ